MNISTADGEFLVNIETDNTQTEATITGLQDGGFVISWRNYSQIAGDGSGSSIKAKIFDVTGRLVKDEFLVNTETDDYQSKPTITSLQNGGFVISWNDKSNTLGDTSGRSIKAKIFDATGALVKDEFLVNTQTHGNQYEPTITGLQNGGFVISWEINSEISGDDSGSSIKAKIFDATGELVKDEFLVNTQTDDSQVVPAITGLQNGGFVISWMDRSEIYGDGSDSSIKAKIFDATGELVKDEFLVNTQTDDSQVVPAITGLQNGGFVISWIDYSEIYGDGSDSSIKAKIFDATGALVKDEFIVNTQTDGSQSDPTITGLQNGGFVISWHDGSVALGSIWGASVKVKMFDATGTLVKDEFFVNADTDHIQSHAVITGLENGGFVISWEYRSDNFRDTNSYSIKAKIFDANGNSVTSTLVNAAPVATNDTINTLSDIAVTFDPLANDSDADGDFLSIGSFTNGANGTVVDDQGGGLTYTPNAGFSGADSFTYDISDGNGGTDTAEVTVTIQADEIPNRPPTESLGNGELSFLLRQGQTLEDILDYEVGTFFEDPDGDPLTFVATGLPEGVIVNFNTGKLFGTVNDTPDTYDVTMFANDGNIGGVEAINFEIRVAERPATVAAGDSLQALVATTLGYETISDAKIHIQQLYSENVKYVLSFGGSLDVSGLGVGAKIETARAVDVADLFEVTAEGRGGTSGNTNGRITIWEDVGVEISKIWGSKAASADLLFTTYLTPINFSPISADNRDDLSVKVGAEGTLTVGGIASISAGASLDVLSLETDASVVVSGKIGPIRAQYDLVSGSGGSGLGIAQAPTGEPEKLLNLSAKVSLGASMTNTLTEIDRLEIDSKGADAAINIVTGDLMWTRSSPNDGITGSSGSDNIIGTVDDDIIWGMGGDDTIKGGAGNDVLYTGGGDGESRNFAKLSGGSGNDVLIYSGHFDWVGIGASGDDTYIVDLGWTVSDYDQSGFDPESGAPNEKIVILELDGFAITNGGTDTIVLLSDKEILDQSITAGRENDYDAFLLVQSENGIFQSGTTTTKIELPDFFKANGAVENVWFAKGSAIDGSISVYRKIDLLERMAKLNVSVDGGSDNDNLVGGEGNDTMNGGDGADVLNGGAGNDVMVGGTSTNDLRDVMFGGNGNDLIDGGYGNDELRGDAGNDTILGGFGADTVIGGTGDDVLTGSALGDNLFGGDGDDFVNGGFGYDRVNGGVGADEFFHIGIANHGSDWIQDYNAADGDVLVFGNANATREQFQINLNTTPTAGDETVEEAFVVYRPTGQIMWALVDGEDQDQINLRIGGDIFDLMA